jgi:DNA polymerase-1
VPGVTLELEAARWGGYDRERVIELFRELEFRTLLARLPEPVAADGSAVEVAEPAHTQVEGRYRLATTAAELDELVAEVRVAGRFALELVADEEHPMRAADALVGAALSTAEGTGWYVPFGHGRTRVAEAVVAAGGGQGGLALDVEMPDDASTAADEGAAADGDGEAEVEAPLVQLSEAEVLGALAPLLTDPAIERVAHNGKAWLVALAESPEHLEAADVSFDTMLVAYLLGDANMTLARLAFDRLGLELMERKALLGTGRKAIPFSEASPADVCGYAAPRVDAVLRLAALLGPELDESGLRDLFDELDQPHIAVLARMERCGVAIDVGVLAQLRAQLEQEVAAAESEVYGSVGHEFQIGSPQQLSQILFEELELPKTRKTRTGWTTDANALEVLRGVHPVVDAVLRWRELTKLKSTYVDTLPGQVNPRTGRVHTVYSQVTAATGRLSSNDPNLQNIPVRTEMGNDVRRAFVARDCGEDPIFLSVDYSQIELRILAYLSGDEALQKAFHDGLDIHAATASRVFGVAPEDVDREQRRRAKVFNFGVLYGLTAFGLTQREGIPRDEAEEFIRAYFEAYPRVAEWRDEVVEEAREKGYAETLTGRRRAVPALRAPDRNQRMAAERIAINMPAQGTAADIIKIAMNRIEPELEQRRREGALARMVLQVHDELIFELPRAELDEVRAIAGRLMPSLDLAVPLELEEKWGRSWGDLDDERSAQP